MVDCSQEIEVDDDFEIKFGDPDEMLSELDSKIGFEPNDLTISGSDYQDHEFDFVSDVWFES
jgi:hypothetical protein